MVRRAFLVAGPESSGTRFMAGILVDAGCYGNRGHGQRLDTKPLEHAPDLIVWRRSLPHAHRWPDLMRMIHRLAAAQYGVCVVAMTRERYALARSQVRRGHVKDMETAYQHIEGAYRSIFGAISIYQGPFVVVSYESLTQHPESAARLLDDWCLTPHVPDVYDGNAPYYEVDNG